MAQEPPHVGSRERTLLPQMCPLKSRIWQQEPPLEGCWGQVSVFYPREPSQRESPRQETFLLEAGEAHRVLLPHRNDIFSSFSNLPLPALSIRHVQKPSSPPSPRSPSREREAMHGFSGAQNCGDSAWPPASIFLLFSLWHVLGDGLPTTEQDVPSLPLLNPNPRGFFHDSSLYDRAYIKRSCFQGKIKNNQWNLEKS